MGNGTNDRVYALAVCGNNLIAGGRLGIASWNGSNWSGFGSGVNDWVNALTDYDGSPIAGGRFTTAGGKVAVSLARWSKKLFLCGDVNNDVARLNILDLTYLVDYYFRNGPAPIVPETADLDSDGNSATLLDLTLMVDYIFRGGATPTCGL